MKLSRWLAAALTLAAAATAAAQTSQTYQFGEGQTTPHAQPPLPKQHHAPHHPEPHGKPKSKHKKPKKHHTPRYVSHRNRYPQA
jgi:hypothetical protein